MGDITQILARVEQGDETASENLMSLVYSELHKLAVAKLSGEKSGQTLQATALVNEAWIRLVDVEYNQSWNSRRHFFGAAAEAMRRILVDRARHRNRLKRGGEWQKITMEPEDWGSASDDDRIESLDAALKRLRESDPDAAELVCLRYFAGLSLKDAANALSLPPRSADRLWAYAKAWLRREIEGKPSDSTSEAS